MSDNSVFELQWKAKLLQGDIQRAVVAHQAIYAPFRQADKRRYYKTSLDMWQFLSLCGKENLSLNRRYLLILRHIAYIKKHTILMISGLKIL